MVEKRYERKHLIISTTPEIQGKQIQEYLGLVAGEAVFGANVFKDFLAGLRDVVGGRSGVYETELRNARNSAIDEMSEQAEDLGANAVVGVDVDYETIGDSMLMVAVSGTAVKLT